MRHIVFILPALLAILVSCRSTDDNTETHEELIPIRFSLLFQKEVLPFPGTRAIPAFDMPEPTVSKGDDDPGEGGNTGIQSFCTTIEYIVYKDNVFTTPLRHRQYTSDDDEYGIIEDKLPPGSYHIVFLAHSSLAATLAEGVLSFDEVSDTFCHTEEITVASGEEVDAMITLERVIGRIEFCPVDELPEGASLFEMEIENYANGYNPVSGEVVTQSTTTTLLHQFTASELEQKKMTHGFFSFIPTNEEYLSVTLKTLDEERMSLNVVSIADIQPIKNTIIRYTGHVYTPAPSTNTFTLSILENGKWEDPIEKEIE